MSDPVTVDEWTDVDAWTDEQMARHARVRRLVKLDDGRIAKLVSWPVYGLVTNRRTRGRTCVVEWMSGKRFRVHVRRVRQVAIPR